MADIGEFVQYMWISKVHKDLERTNRQLSEDVRHLIENATLNKVTITIIKVELDLINNYYVTKLRGIKNDT